MTDNTQIAVGSGGDVIRDIDRTGQPGGVAAKTQVIQLDAGGQYLETLVSQTNPLPVRDLLSNEGGLTAVDLLTQILVELRILTRMTSELPLYLNSGTKLDEPEAMRVDPSLYPYNGSNNN